MRPRNEERRLTDRPQASEAPETEINWNHRLSATKKPAPKTQVRASNQSLFLLLNLFNLLMQQIGPDGDAKIKGGNEHQQDGVPVPDGIPHRNNRQVQEQAAHDRIEENHS